MKLAEGIRKHGFMKWYERELMHGHAHLLLMLVCALGLVMALEAATRFRSLTDQAIDIASVLICFGAGLWALNRYLYLLFHAEGVANQANCPACKTYGRLELLRTGHRGDDVDVRCRKCGHEWGIES